MYGLIYILYSKADILRQEQKNEPNTENIMADGDIK